MNNKSRKITVVGLGYVGLSLSVLLSQKNKVIALDIVKEKVDMINNRVSPINDDDITYFFDNVKLDLTATLDKEKAYKNADFIIIATPTDYDDVIEYFNTSTVDETLKDIYNYNRDPTVILKSTLPIGFTELRKRTWKDMEIMFSPEFLREGKALYDNLYPSRIIVGDDSEEAKEFANLLVECASKKDIPLLFVNSTEAEAIKLFSNTYLAMRVAFFNELDTYAESRNLNTRQIIEGVSLDDRIGDYYNNPSFGYGGYCLPKDTKQMLSNYDKIPQQLISAIVSSNHTRKEHIVKSIVINNPNVVGVYRLEMKKGSDNFRFSAIVDIINMLIDMNINVYIYEPNIIDNKFNKAIVIKDFDKFKKTSDIIITNRYFDELEDVKEKVYTRDIFSRD